MDGYLEILERVFQAQYDMMKIKITVHPANFIKIGSKTGRRRIR
jgi:hypothetical protein